MKIIVSDDPLLQTLAAAGTFVLTLLATWLVPILLRYVFGYLLRVEVIYDPPHDDADDEYATSDAMRALRYRYAHASWWRTHFWGGLYLFLRVFIFFTGLIIAFWMVHEDLNYIAQGLGITFFIVLLGLGQFFSNAAAYIWLVVTGTPVRHGDYVEIGAHHGVVVSIGPLWITLHGEYPLHGATLLQGTQPAISPTTIPFVTPNTAPAAAAQSAAVLLHRRATAATGLPPPGAPGQNLEFQPASSWT